MEDSGKPLRNLSGSARAVHVSEAKPWAQHPLDHSFFRYCTIDRFRALLLAIALLLLHSLDIYRRPGARLWVLRIIKRDEGSYIVTNIKLAVPIAAVVILSTLVGYIVEEYNVAVNSGNQRRIGGWRTGATCTFVFGGWIITFAGLQAYLLSRPFGKGFGWKVLRPLVVNILYLGGGAVLAVAMLVTTVVATRAHASAYDSYQSVCEELAAKDPLSSSFNDMLPTLKAFNTSCIREQIITAITFGVLTASLWASALINLGSLGLLYTLRQSINFKLSELAGHVWTRQIGTINDEEAESESRTEHVVGEGPVNGEEQLSRSQIRKIAKTETDVSRRGRAQQ
ncbi:hypothetical protein P7C70_g6147, partial [Phenoliferia sp. Uapishka_3]